MKLVFLLIYLLPLCFLQRYEYPITPLIFRHCQVTANGSHGLDVVAEVISLQGKSNVMI